MPTAAIFYVYEHWRPDKDVCFYVGKGHGDRAWIAAKRNRHYQNIIAKLARLGMCPEVRLVESAMIEPAALALEVARIAFWRSSGVVLSNLTAGGEGVVGLKHSEATRAIIRRKRRTQKIVHSEETKKKIGAANLGVLKGRKNPEHSARLKGRKLSAETRAKIGQSNMGHVVSEETRARIGASNVGKVRSTETREKLSVSHRGKKPSSETRSKMTVSHKKRWGDPELRMSVRSKMVAQWNDPDYRSRVMASREKANTPEYRAKLSAAAKADWARRREHSPCR
jgi:hypothetical protein